MAEQLRIVKTLSELQQLEDYIIDKDFVAFDTETTGVVKGSQIIGVSIAAEVDVAYYVILSYWDTEQQKLMDLETTQNITTLLTKLIDKRLIMHNAVFDCMMVANNYLIDLMPSVHTDTMILAHLLDENRRNGLKELGASFFGESSRKEQAEMKESVSKNGGSLTKDCYELYKADADLIARYGAKDAILTLKIFEVLVPELFEQKLDKFFYEEESMPLLRGPTYDMNVTGLRIDPAALMILKKTLEAECLEAKAFIYKEITPYVKEKYPATGKSNVFNINAPMQMSWLVFIKLDNVFNTLTDSGKEICKFLDIKRPYTNAAKRDFIQQIEASKGVEYAPGVYNYKTQKMSKPKTIGNPWNYLSCGRESLEKAAKRYKWAEVFLEYKKNMKLLNTYVEGIQTKAQYNIIRPSFLQHGTTSGRYSCKQPNFQNLPRDDKRVKSCMISRPGKVFVGADQSQLEPRVFASVSQDQRLMECFANGEDFYSVVGAPIFNKEHCSMFKNDKNSFANKYPDLRHISKAFALATPYGTSAFQQSIKLHLPIDQCEEIIDKYFSAYPQVEQMMLDSHAQARKNGVVYNLFGRPRRIPEAKNIPNKAHRELPYAERTLLNLGMNHRVQSTAASIMNRAAIAIYEKIKEYAKQDSLWLEAHIVLQVHDQFVLEVPEKLAEQTKTMLKYCMEDTVVLPGVKLVADPIISYNLAEQK